jgi:methionine synthase II (cobalamin-independent)
MILSRDRILTTHVGSLPRREALSTLLIRREEGQAIDKSEFAAEMDRAVNHVVRKQMEARIDIGNDGEQQRVGFQTYVPQRMSGFAGESKRRRGRDFEAFPEDPEISALREIRRRFHRILHDGAVSRHHLDDDAQRPLRLARGVPLCTRTRNA